jgi:hypothetical protein
MSARTPLSGTDQPGSASFDGDASLTRPQDDNLAVQGTPDNDTLADEEEMEADLIEQEELEDATAGLDGDDPDADETELDEDDEVIPLPDQSQPGGYR